MFAANRQGRILLHGTLKSVTGLALESPGLKSGPEPRAESEHL